jgi:hypothetical protein
MRVTVSRSNILKLGKRLVFSASPSEGVVPMVDMHLSFGVSIPRLLDMGGNSLRISVYDRDIYLDTRAFVTSVTGDSLTESTVSESVEKDRITRVRDELCLYKENIDITKFISNDMAKSSQKGDKRHTVDYISILNSSTGNRGVRVSPEIPASSPTQADESFMRDLLSRGIDPATVSTRFPVPDPSNVRRFHRETPKQPRPSDGKDVDVFSVVGSPGIYVKSSVRSSYYPVSHIVQMPYAKLSQVSKLYFHIEALGGGNLTVDYEVQQFDTKLMISDIDRQLANSVNMMNSSKSGEITNYSREVMPPRSKRLSYFLPFKGGSDQVSPFRKGNALILRSTAGNRNSISTRFVSRVFLRKNPITPSAQHGTDDIPFFIIRNGDSLQVRIPSVPQRVVSVQLQRKDVFRRGNFLNIGSPTLATLGDSVTLSDTDLRDSSTYEYRIAFTDSRSNRRFTSNTQLYHYVSSALSPSCTLTIAGVEKGTFAAAVGNVPTVTITVDAGTVEKGIQGTKEFLRSKGVDVSLLGDLSNDSASYKHLPIFEVTRFNMRTGETESLGKFSDSKIVDDSAVPGGKVKGIEPLSFFEVYRYIVRLGLRSPSALTTKQTSQAVDPATGRSYTYNSYKFKSRRHGSDLPSVHEMSQMASKSVTDVNIDMMDVGAESSVNVNFEDSQPSVFGLSVRKSFVMSNLLTWRVSGEQKLVDHFQVYAEADGVRALVGCAHPYTNDGEYRYDDRQLYNRVGNVTYNVVPIRLDFTRALGDAKVSVVNESTLLDFLRE